MNCGACGRTVPDGRFCCRCGAVAGSGVGPRFHYAADPSEPAFAVRVTSSLLPQLPQHDAVAFRVALASGATTIVVLGALGLFSLGLVAAAALVPLLMVLYFYDVDVYEDQPLLVVGATLLWGGLVGAVLGVFLADVRPLAAGSFGGLTGTDVLVRVVVFPAVELLLGFVGVVVLLRDRRFNDVLDGTCFGAATLVAVSSAVMLVAGWPSAQVGFVPRADRVVTTLRLLEVGVLVPVAAAAAAGWIGGALWLRFRAPTVPSGAAGVAGRPVTAVIGGYAVFVAAAFVVVAVPEPARGVLLVLLAVVAVVVLRRVVHLGLLNEADEREIGPEVVCVNCGRSTRAHTFCSWCGVALRALPKRPGGRS